MCKRKYANQQMIAVLRMLLDVGGEIWLYDQGMHLSTFIEKMVNEND